MNWSYYLNNDAVKFSDFQNIVVLSNHNNTRFVELILPHSFEEITI